jgi:hypothetical protein
MGNIELEVIIYTCIFVKEKKVKLALLEDVDRLCGLVGRVPGYRYKGPGSISGATRFSEKLWVWNGVHSGL